MNRIYRIGRLQPSQVIPSARLLRSEGLQPAVPTYQKTIRGGRSRRRETKLLQVLPGFIFLPDNEAPEAAAYLSQIGRRLTWLKNPTLQGSFATCSVNELRPLFDWAERKPQPTEEEEFLRTLHVGQRVRVKEGVFVGLYGVILRGPALRGDSPLVTVELSSGIPVTIPVGLLEHNKIPLAID